MVSRSILCQRLPLRRKAIVANAIAVGALLIASASPGAAAAATVSVEPAWFYPLQYVAATGERNDVLVVYNDNTNRDVTITDASAPLTAGESCSALDGHSVRCSYDFGPTGYDLDARVKLGDMADRLRVSKPSAAGGEESYMSASTLAEGGSGRDVLSGSFGLDSLRGGRGADRLLGGGSDFLTGGPGDDLLVGRAGARDLFGSHINGGPGADTLLGSDETDALDGGTGDDQLLAGNGDDKLVGGPGSDRFACGGGVDRVGDPQPGRPLASACEVIRIEDPNITADVVAFEFSPRPMLTSPRSLIYHFGCETHMTEPLPYRCSGRLDLREAFGARRLLAHGRFQHAGRDGETWNVRARLTTLGRRIATQRRSIVASGSLTGQGLVKSRIRWTFRLSFVSA